MRSLVMDIVPPIVEVTDAPHGLVELKVRDCRGARIGFFQASDSDLDDELTDALLAWAQRHSHQGAGLSIVRSSASAP